MFCTTQNTFTLNIADAGLVIFKDGHMEVWREFDFLKNVDKSRDAEVRATSSDSVEDSFFN